VLQLLVLQPLAVTSLDFMLRRESVSWTRIISGPARNPLTVATASGLAVAGADIDVPAPLLAPFEVVGGMAVPVMLLAYGAFLWLAPPASVRAPSAALALALVTKGAVHPAVAGGFGWVLGLDNRTWVAVTMCAALPTAHNVFLVATHYRVLVPLVRDCILWGTMTSAVTLVVLTTAFL